VSNAEETSGGVGAIKFNSNGQVINYEIILENTSQNCGGGKTYWGTWVSEIVG
jgi:secreted PhoX family phosphatase